jgi:hypothetical protein
MYKTALTLIEVEDAAVQWTLIIFKMTDFIDREETPQISFSFLASSIFF